jgi:hypothetical protein
MTKAELIKSLESFPDDAEVFVNVEGCILQTKDIGEYLSCDNFNGSPVINYFEN